MARPFDEAGDSHPTPPLSPSTSSGSSRGSSAPSLSPSHLSSLLPEDIDRSHPTHPDSQPLKHCDPTLSLMPDDHNHDPMILDDWEEEQRGRPERGQELVSLSFQLESSSSRSAESTSYSQLPSESQQRVQLSQGFNSLPSPDVIDVTKLARQNQPPPAYENVDERPASNVPRSSPLTTRPPRPLPMPPINSISSSSGIQSLSPATGAAPAEPYENANPAPLSCSSSSDRLSPVFSTGRVFPSSVGPSQSPAVPVGLLHPLNHSSSQDWLDKHSAGISPLSSQSPFNFLSPRVAPEHSQHSISSASFDHDSSWTANQSFPSTQRGTSAAPVSSRPVSIPGSIQTLSPPPPYSSCEASSSRSASHPSSEYINEMRSTHRPPLEAALNPSSHGAPPEAALNPSSHVLPPPAPPTILDPPPARHSSTRSSRAPHEPFLCDAPPPPDSWIAVETTPVEYRLVARLPGFRRDAITLAARRRRVLHVVADSWEPGGGHFERRISFGYDADLTRVRAEFDGEILRVIVPRRTPLLAWYGYEEHVNSS